LMITLIVLKSTSVSELFCDSNVLTHPLSVANKSNEYFSHVRPNFVEKFLVYLVLV